MIETEVYTRPTVVSTAASHYTEASPGGEVSATCGVCACVCRVLHCRYAEIASAIGEMSGDRVCVGFRPMACGENTSCALRGEASFVAWFWRLSRGLDRDLDVGRLEDRGSLAPSYLGSFRFILFPPPHLFRQAITALE